MTGMSRLGRGIGRIETLQIALASIAMAAIMLVVVADVLMRYVFSSPLIWSYDLISLYLMVTLFFFALSHTLEQHGHIAIDIFAPLIPRRLRHLFEGLGYAAVTVIVAAITWLSAERMVESFLAGELMASAVSWPTWVAQVPVVLGAGLLTLRCLYRAVGHLASTVAAIPLIELPTDHQSEGASE